MPAVHHPRELPTAQQQQQQLLLLLQPVLPARRVQVCSGEE